jgi:hypothetical protein
MEPRAHQRLFLTRATTLPSKQQYARLDSQKLNLLKPKCQNAPRQACCLVRGPSGARTSRRNQGIALSRQNTPERANAVAQLAQKAQVLALAKFNSRIGGLHREELKFTVNTAFRWKHLRLPIYLKHTVIQHDVTSSYALKQ